MGLSKRMVLLDKPSQALLDDMRIDLGGRNVGVAEKLLNGAEIGAALQEMAGEGVAQHMG
jgi:hypothetical protein